MSWPPNNAHIKKPQFVFNDNTENGPFMSAFKILDQMIQSYIHSENTPYVKENINEVFSILFTCT